MKHALLFILSLTLMLSCNRCKDKECTDSHNPDCPNYVAPADPCASSSAVSAEFKILQSSGTGTNETFHESDTSVIFENVVILRALSRAGATYKWIIGTDTIHAQNYSFSFNQNQAGITVPIKLIVQAPIDSLCFPLDNGIDTVVHNVYSVQNCDSHIMHTFRGVWLDAPTDTFEMGFYGEQHLTSSVYPACDRLYYFNFDKSGSSCENSGGIIFFFNDYIKFNNPLASCSDPVGFARTLDGGNRMHAEYRLFNPDQPFDQSLWPLHIFDGYKVN